MDSKNLKSEFKTSSQIPDIHLKKRCFLMEEFDQNIFARLVCLKFQMDHPPKKRPSSILATTVPYTKITLCWISTLKSSKLSPENLTSNMVQPSPPTLMTFAPVAGKMRERSVRAFTNQHFGSWRLHQTLQPNLTHLPSEAKTGVQMLLLFEGSGLKPTASGLSNGRKCLFDSETC